MTKTGSTIGTFAYIAPERLDGQGEEDARVDIYSLACVLYECLAGEAPFGGDTMARLVFAHVNNPPPRPSIAQAGVPEPLDEVIATGMAKDPDHRYATTVELATAAHDAITTPITRPTQNPGTHPAFVTSPAPPVHATEPAAQQQAAGLNLVATQLGPADGPPPDTSAPPPPWWRRPRRQVQLGLIVVTVVILVVGIIGVTGYFLLQHKHESQTSTAQSTTRSGPTAPPVTEAALDGLLLTPDQINTAMSTQTLEVRGGTGTTVPSHKPDNGVTVSDPACRPYFTDGFSGATAVRSQQLNSQVDTRLPTGFYAAFQAVFVFPSAQDASAVFNSSAQHWAACSNRPVSVSRGGNDADTWTMGPVSNTDGTLSFTMTQTITPATNPLSQSYVRVLTVVNNVVINVETVSPTPLSGVAVNIAHQIAAKVPTT
jgi:serine/threonine kinase PknH